MKLAGVGEGALVRGRADLHELAQNRPLIGAKNIERPGENGDDLFEALVANEAGLETQHAWVDSVQCWVDRRIGMVAEHIGSAAQIFEQASLPIQQSIVHVYAQLIWRDVHGRVRHRREVLKWPLIGPPARL